MEYIVKKEQFDGYTHRFKVELETGDLHQTNIDLYVNNGSYSKLTEFLESRLKEKNISFDIVNVSSKEQDEADAQFINELMKSDFLPDTDYHCVECGTGFNESKCPSCNNIIKVYHV
jgi:rubrerythrin